MDELLSRLTAAMARLRASVPGGRLTGRVRLPPVVAGGARRLSAGMRRVVERIGPGRAPILYRDPMMILDRDGVVVNGYLYPMGRRRIPYARIRAVEPYPLTGARAYRVHGYGWPRQWYHRDRRRGERAVGLLLRTDGWLHPVLTPVEPDVVRRLLGQQIAGSGTR